MLNRGCPPYNIEIVQTTSKTYPVGRQRNEAA